MTATNPCLSQSPAAQIPYCFLHLTSESIIVSSALKLPLVALAPDITANPLCLPKPPSFASFGFPCLFNVFKCILCRSISALASKNLGSPTQQSVVFVVLHCQDALLLDVQAQLVSNTTCPPPRPAFTSVNHTHPWLRDHLCQPKPQARARPCPVIAHKCPSLSH